MNKLQERVGYNSQLGLRIIHTKTVSQPRLALGDNLQYQSWHGVSRDNFGSAFHFYFQ